MQTHLAFGGMNVTVEGQRIHRNPQHGERVSPLGKRFRVSLAERLKNSRTLHHSTIENHKLKFPVGSALPRFGDKALDPNPIILSWLDGHESRYEIGSEEIANTHFVIICGCRLPSESPIAHERNRHVGMRNGEGLHLLQNVSRLGLLAAQEFFARREIEE
jgi:hypothetical protein